jgi:choice-of-anchor B domain-containing protein
MNYIKLFVFIVSFNFLFPIVECENGQADGYPCSNMDLMSRLSLAQLGNPGNGNDIWGWVDPENGDPYALMGLDTGTAFIRITDPENPLVIGYLPTHTSASLWRDIKTYQNHAFIVSEAGGHGMQVFDLTQLRNYDGNNPVTFSNTTHYGLFGNCHNIVINEDTGFAYAVGSDDCSGGLHMVNIQNPSNPSYAGCYSQDGYTHDTQCVIYDGVDTDYIGREICFSSNEDTVTITDVTNKNNPTTISINGYAGAQYTHQGWLTEDHKYFLCNDELDEYYDGINTSTYIWDLSSLDNPTLINVHDHGTPNIDHNLYIEGNYVYQSHYTAGLRIHDLSNISEGIMEEVAFFDIHPQNNSTTFDGTWSNYPFFDNNIVIVSGIGDGGNVESGGLFVLQFNEPANAELSLSYDDAIMETSLNTGESESYQLQILNTGEEGSNLSYDVSASVFLDTQGSDNSGNSWSSSDYGTSFDWIDIEGISTLVNFTNNDSANGTIPIGFEFPIYGQSYTECSVNANGWIGFGGDSGAWDNSSLPTDEVPGPALFPFWDDLNPVNDQCNQYCSGNVYYYSSSDVFIITFDQVAHWWTNFENSFYTFQVVMYPNGDVYFNYLDLQGDYSSATVGIQNQNASDAITMGENNTDALLANNFSISIKQVPSWVQISNGSGNLSDGQGAAVPITITAENLGDGIYNGYLFINTNTEDVTIPLVLNVNDEPQIPGDINNDGSLNVQDIVVLVNNYILIGQYDTIGDINQDGDLNVLDVIILVNLILG